MSKSFYSQSQGLCLTVSHGALKEIAGQTVRIGEKWAQFQPAPGPGKFGVCVTEDPDIILFLEKRAAQNPEEIFDEAEYKKRSVPAETRAKESARQLEEANKLIAQLQAQLADKKK